MQRDTILANLDCYEKPARLITRTTFVKLSDGMLNLLDRCSNFIGAGVPFAPRRKNRTFCIELVSTDDWLLEEKKLSLVVLSLRLARSDLALNSRREALPKDAIAKNCSSWKLKIALQYFFWVFQIMKISCNTWSQRHSPWKISDTKIGYLMIESVQAKRKNFIWVGAPWRA